MTTRKLPLRSAVSWIGNHRPPLTSGRAIVYRCQFGDSTGTVDEAGPAPICPNHLIPMVPAS